MQLLDLNQSQMYKTHSVKIVPCSIEVDGTPLEVSSHGTGLLKEIYHTRIGGYPKFHKMDLLCQVGFIASELLLEAEGKARFVECDDRAVLLFGKHASICADRQYQATIIDKDTFFPSPSVFVYTLPNIVTGEIALRNKYHGETSYLMLEDKAELNKYLLSVFETTSWIKSAIGGWIDATDSEHFETEMWIIEKIINN